jgi:hypothetical protein
MIPTCKAPITATHPNGDPSLEFYKCHGGEQLLIFRNLLRVGLPDRDGLDVPCSRLGVDSWTSFARTRHPDPAIAYLSTRGYISALKQVAERGRCESANNGNPIRNLQWDGFQAQYSEVDQCAAIGVSYQLLYLRPHTWAKHTLSHWAFAEGTSN